MEIEITADGSATLYVKELDEHYHSVKGAIAESNHIYRDCAFLYRSDGTSLRLLEIGFGTGLNAAVTAMAANAQNPIHYITLEKYPITEALYTALDYGKLVDSQLLEKIYKAPWDTPTAITPYFTLEKRQADYLCDPLPHNIDIVYFDAFAPEKQPDMWSEDAFRRLYDTMNDKAVLTTYCAKGSIRRLLTEIGFSVERISGPLGGKREILRATKHL
ncbi:MAG: tRNA (5-methylaminomethyl-2-thiouridine)(34)-methyltransferase MnmD [Bacteroidaceae bacterium]|nr:tRNA (5-methylaminomethyl-2-thiouridine)(34)-methyltransferase MnmD [Bacteroidaceae bacterium]